MSEKTKVTFKNHKSIIKSACGTAKRAFVRFQDVLVFGLEHYQAHGNTIVLSNLVNAMNDTHGMNADRCKRYIEARANVRLQKNKDGEFVFKKDTKRGEAPTLFDNKDSEGNITAWPSWYDFDKKGDLKVVDELKVISQLASRLESNRDKGNVVNRARANEAIRLLIEAQASLEKWTPDVKKQPGVKKQKAA